ncbi:hypothetical protein MNBD_CHLOROFLEXI01-231 [hydrothermal vent metagenome]|uniref:Uncharacterized protein n=1 Tax=hydrothermal vent metagenome TaxID=652676 RepID=A0A3B0UUZ3_9ZZZZ
MRQFRVEHLFIFPKLPNLDAELNKLLKMMELVPETAVSPQNHTLWQRMSHFLRPEKQQLITLPKLMPSVKQENGALGKGETAVSLSPQPPTVPLEPATPNAESSRPRLTIYCLGTFRVYEDEYPIEAWPSRKGKSILALWDIMG